MILCTRQIADEMLPFCCRDGGLYQYKAWICRMSNEMSGKHEFFLFPIFCIFRPEIGSDPVIPEKSWDIHDFLKKIPPEPVAFPKQMCYNMRW